MLVQPGVHYYSGWLSREGQEALVTELETALEIAPWFQPTMPRWGTPFSVRMTNLGPLGWVSDKSGYRYQALHPDTGNPWPQLPESIRDLWRDVAHYPHPPEACLVNYYGGKAKMGLHQDRDEQALEAPVVSISLGDSCLFRFGGEVRSGPTRSLRLHSGDVVLIGGASRLAFHGVDKIYGGTSTLLSQGGRINLTLRRVTKV